MYIRLNFSVYKTHVHIPVRKRLHRNTGVFIYIYIYISVIAVILKIRLLLYCYRLWVKVYIFAVQTKLRPFCVGTAHHQHGFEACTVLVCLGLCWLKLSALN